MWGEGSTFWGEMSTEVMGEAVTRRSFAAAAEKLKPFLSLGSFLDARYPP